MQKRGSSWLLGAPRKADARAILFCFPHGGGSAQSLTSLVEAAPPSIDVIAVQLPGRGPRFAEAFADTCDAFLDELLPIMAEAIDRPYALFGHSIGAALAFAAAQAFERLGDEPPLALFASAFAPPAAGGMRGNGQLSTADWLQFSDHDFLAQLARFAPVDPRAWTDASLRDLIVAPTRADFRLAGTVPFEGGAAIATPIFALGGQEDVEATPEDLVAWRGVTSGAFAREIFSGGHFYFEPDAAPIARFVSSTLEGLIAARPPSLAFGAPSTIREGCDIYRRFREAAQGSPDAIAIHDGDVRLTFADLETAAAGVHAQLAALDVRRGDLCGVCLPNSAALVVAMLAILRLGAAFFQIPQTLPAEARRAAATDLSLAAVVASPGETNAFAGAVLPLDNAALAAGATPPAHCPRPDPACASDVAFGVLSSGTTGRPKAILCTHRSALLAYDWRSRETPARTGAREAAGVFFIWEVLRPLLDGRPVWVVPDAALRDPRAVAGYIADHGVTRILMTPSLLERVLGLPEVEIARARDSLATVIANGEVVTAKLTRLFCSVLPGADLVNDYSISECHDVTTTLPGDLRRADGKLRFGATASSGRAMDGVRVYILDGAKALQPYGVPGEVYVAGDTLAKGYRNAPEEMAARFVPDPFQPPGRSMFRTGDVGRLLPGGRLQVYGRSRFMIKLRGYSIVPAAVESVMADVDGVRAAALLTVDDPETGQPDHLVAAVVLDEAAGKDGDALARVKGEVRRRLPPEAVPARFVAVEAIPICARTGKRDTPALMKLCTTGDSATARPTAARASLAADPRLTASWREILGVVDVAATDNFFDHGGHSLKAADFASRLRETFSRNVDVADIYAHPTFAELAAFLGCAGSSDVDAPIARARVSETARAAARETDATARDIAVVGWACRFPGIGSPEDLWRAVAEGRETHREPVAGDKPRGAILDGVEDFDAGFWGLSRREAILTDPQHRLFLELAWAALENAGHRPSDCGHDIGVFAGTYLPSYLVHHLGAVRHLDPANPTLFHLAEAGNDKDYLASRTAFLMDLHGPAITVQSSCSTGLVAICEAAAAIRAGRCRMALAGASSLTFPRGGLMPAEGHVVSPSGRVRTFDADADGTLLGEGAGVVVLRPLADAIADGDTIRAVIKGFGVNNDGRRKAGFSAPSATGQADVLRAALADAGVSPDAIGYIEAHGTGTAIGDPLEVRALKEVYGASAADDAERVCSIGSLKPNIAHANIASGIAGFISAANVLRHGVVPALTNFTSPNPELRLEGTRLAIASSPRAWPQRDSGPRRAAVSSFGIGGTNAHLILEEAPDAARADVEDAADGPVSLVVSAKTRPALAEAARNLAAALREPHPPRLQDIAFTLAHGRMAFAERLVIPTDNHATAAAMLTEAAEAVQAGRPVDSVLEDNMAATSGRRVALPTYPFARERCWPDRDIPEQDEPLRPDTRLPFDQRFHVVARRRIPLPMPDTPYDRGDASVGRACAVVLPGGTSPLFGAATALVRRLADAGRSPLLVPAPSWPAERKDAAIRTTAAAWAAELHARLSGRGGNDGADRTGDLILCDTAHVLSAVGAQLTALTTTDATFRLLALADAIDAAFAGTNVRVWLVGETAGEAEASGPDTVLFDLIAGAVLALNQERPRMAVRHVAMSATAESTVSAEALFRLVAAAEPPRPIALELDGLAACAVEPDPFPLNEVATREGRRRLTTGGTHVILGGLGRIGAALAGHLLDLGCRVCVTSRRSIEIPDTLTARADGRLRAVAVDPSDQVALCDLLSGLAEDGGIGTIFQCAGVADLAPADMLTPAIIEAEFAAKIDVTNALRSVIDRLPPDSRQRPDCVVLFSSLAADLGGLGMAAYAAANRYLDHAARAGNRHSSGPRLPVWHSIAWDDWDFVYGKEQTASWARTRAHLALPVDEAIAALEAVIGDGSAATIAVSASDLDQRWRAWRSPDKRAVCGRAATRPAESFRSCEIEPEDTQKPVEWALPTIVETVLGAYRTSLARPDADADSDFFDLGGDSLLAADVASALDETLPRSLRPRIVDILEHPSPSRLAGVLSRRDVISGPAVMAAQ